ncbi:MAG TPA: hypothetical protein ENO24_05510, partial [Chloroflexi bacterium]|nr:hypothetical protein [Chloroflexota bacterium]
MDKQEAQQDLLRAELAAFLKQHQEEIATAWAELVHASPGSSLASLSPDDVRYVMSRGLEAMAQSLETGSRTVLEVY